MGNISPIGPDSSYRGTSGSLAGAVTDAGQKVLKGLEEKIFNPLDEYGNPDKEHGTPSKSIWDLIFDFLRGDKGKPRALFAREANPTTPGGAAAVPVASSTGPVDIKAV